MNEVLKTNIDLVKIYVGCDRLAEDEVVLRGQGRTLRGQCPILHCEGSSESFAVYLNESMGVYDSFYCFRCGKSGDVIDLHEAMRHYLPNPAHTVKDLAQRFGVKLMREEDTMTDEEMAEREGKKMAVQDFRRAEAALLFETGIVPQIQQIKDPHARARTLAICLKAAGLDH